MLRCESKRPEWESGNILGGRITNIFYLFFYFLIFFGGTHLGFQMEKVLTYIRKRRKTAMFDNPSLFTTSPRNPRLHINQPIPPKPKR